MTETSAPPRGRILLVGCGKMGRALATGWLARGLPPADLIAVEPGEAAAEAAAAGVPVVADLASVDSAFVPEWVVLAVKPQVVAEAAAPYARYVATAHFLSIAAGKTLSALTAALGTGARIVRSMPNTPAAVGLGMTVALAGPGVEKDARQQCAALLRAVGDVAWIDDEEQMDAVTAVSGSGPAYVFLLIECLAEAGREAGLPGGLAMRLARATVIGAGELARQDGSTDAGTLRRNVTSPGGTTEAALEVLTAPGGLRELLVRAVAAAAARSRALAD